MPFTAAHTYIAHIWRPPPPPRDVTAVLALEIFDKHRQYSYTPRYGHPLNVKTSLLLWTGYFVPGKRKLIHFL